jgi:outer membrane protein assembly factor BamB
MWARAAIALLASLLVATPAAGRPAGRLPANDGEWLSYGHDSRLTNAVVSPTLRPTTVPNLHEQWHAELDGRVVASPLFSNGVVYAGTEAGSVYALDAADGHVLWQQQTGTAFECGTTFGISSTGVIDRDRHALYEIGADGQLHALDLATGAEMPGFPSAVVASPSTQYVWGGLRIVGRTLYVPFASYCDELTADDGLADGGIVGIDLDDPAGRVVFDAVAGDGNGGGVWGYGGVAAEPDGSFLYAGVGNSHVFDPLCGCDRDDAPFGDRLVKLTPSLQVVDSNYPPGINPQGDQDFGSAPLLFQPRGCPPLAAANNKNGLLYVWKRSDLAAGPIVHLGVSDGEAAFVGQPSWSSRLQMLFDAEARVPRDGEKTGDGIVAVKTGFKTCRFREVWRTQIGAGNQAPPLVVGDVVFAGGGREGGLYALDAATGAVLWSQPTDGARTFSPLIEARKWLFAPVGAEIRAYAVEAGARAAPRHQLGSHTRANGT